MAQVVEPWPLVQPTGTSAPRPRAAEVAGWRVLLPSAGRGDRRPPAALPEVPRVPGPPSMAVNTRSSGRLPATSGASSAVVLDASPVGALRRGCLRHAETPGAVQGLLNPHQGPSHRRASPHRPA
jgi:hypothetical protein